MKGSAGDNRNWMSPLGWFLALALCPWVQTAGAQEPPPTFSPPPSGPPVSSANGREIVAEVVIIGNRTIPTEKIMRYIKTRPNREFDRAIIHSDVTELAESRMFKAVREREERTAAGLVVQFHVQEFPNTIQDIQFKHANHIKKKDIDEMCRIRKGMPLDPVTNRHICFEIEQFLKKKGRYFASVSLEEGYSPDHTRVIFNVSEGPIVRVRNIRFEGNQELANDARLKTQIDSSPAFIGLVGGVYVPAMIESDVLKLEEYYQSNGYRDARITREQIFSDDFAYVDLVFHIHEGVRYRVKDIVVEGPKSLENNQIKSVVMTKPGEFYNDGKVSTDIRYITDLYGWRGYPVAVQKEVFMVPNEPGVVRVQYQVNEKAPAKVGQVVIVGNDVTKDRVIRRLIGLYPGQTLRYPELRIAEGNLARANIFDMNPDLGTRPSVTVLDPDSDSEYKDVLVQVKETQTGSLMFGAGVNSDAGLVGSIVLNERNFDIFRPPTSLADIFEGRAFRGGGQEFRLEAVPGTQLQRYTVSLREPFLFDRPYSLTTSGYYYDRVFNEYTENRYGGRVNLAHQFTREISANVGMRVENVGVYNVSPFAPLDYTSVQGQNFLTAPRVGVTYDTRDSYLRPTEGGIVDFSYEQAFGAFTAPIFNLEASRFFNLFQRADGSGKHVIAARTQVSYAGAETPVYERFFAGGYRSLRGFQFRGVGPNDNGYMVGGQFMFLNSLEYQIPVKANDQMYFVTFCDTGTVERDVAIRDYRVSVGVGIRLVVPMFGPVPIALDFGFPIVKAQTDQDQLVSFWVGLFR